MIQISSEVLFLQLLTWPKHDKFSLAGIQFQSVELHPFFNVVCALRFLKGVFFCMYVCVYLFHVIFHQQVKYFCMTMCWVNLHWSLFWWVCCSDAEIAVPWLLIGVKPKKNITVNTKFKFIDIQKDFLVHCINAVLRSVANSTVKSMFPCSTICHWTVYKCSLTTVVGCISWLIIWKQAMSIHKLLENSFLKDFREEA